MRLHHHHCSRRRVVYNSSCKKTRRRRNARARSTHVGLLAASSHTRARLLRCHVTHRRRPTAARRRVATAARAERDPAIRLKAYQHLQPLYGPCEVSVCRAARRRRRRPLAMIAAAARLQSTPWAALGNHRGCRAAGTAASGVLRSLDHLHHLVSGEGSDCQPQMLANPCECALSACTSLAAAPLRAWLLAAHGVIIAARP